MREVPEGKLKKEILNYIEIMLMKYIVEESLENFKFWSGGKARANLLTRTQLEKLDTELTAYFADWEEHPTDTEINDLFWFEFGFVCSLIGLMYKNDGNVYDSERWEEHVKEVLTRSEHVRDIFDIYWEGFKDSTELDCLTDDDEIKVEWDGYISDNWLDHAHEVLGARFPEINEDARDTFACEYWQNCETDEYNCDNFQIWWDEAKEEYEED